MAVKPRNSEEKTTSTPDLYTGINAVTLVAVNPTLEGLQKIGKNFQKEPEYLGTNPEGLKKVRMDLYLATLDGKLVDKVSFFLEEKPVSSPKGSAQYINNLGQSTWALSLEDAIAKVGKNGMPWFKPNGARLALVGEVDLINFLYNLLNISSGEDMYLDNIGGLFNGNYKELQAWQNMNYRCKVLFTVKQDKYQSVYSRWSCKYVGVNEKVSLSTHVKKQVEGGYPLKDAWSYDFKVWEPPLPDAEPARAGAGAADMPEGDF